MLPQDLFVPGLAAFLVGHVLLRRRLLDARPARRVALAVAAVVVLAVVVPLGRRILAEIVRAGQPAELRVAVAVYMAVISAMLATALASGNVVAAVGRGAVRRLRLDDRLGPLRAAVRVGAGGDHGDVPPRVRPGWSRRSFVEYWVLRRPASVSILLRDRSRCRLASGRMLRTVADERDPARDARR